MYVPKNYNPLANLNTCGIVAITMTLHFYTQGCWRAVARTQSLYIYDTYVVDIC